MPAKISKSLNIKGILPAANSTFAKEMKAAIADVIVEQIISGISPVKGKNRFKKYSKSYAKVKGREAPVDMLDTGNMLNSLKVVQKRGLPATIEIIFKDIVATYHNDLGAGKSKVIRRLLPNRSGEEFKKTIQNKINALAQKAIDKAVQKANA